MSVKNRATKQIQITHSNINRNETKVLTKQQAQARLDWYGEMIPLYGTKNAEWFKWAVMRMDELNQMLKKQPNGTR